MAGNPNQYSEGFHGIDFVNNMGFIWGNPEFPDSLAANHLGGNHTLLFSGIDWWGLPMWQATLTYGVSGIIASRSPILDQTGWFWQQTGTPSTLVYPFNIYYSGATRFHWDTRHPDEGGVGKGGANQLALYNQYTPKLRTAYDIQNSVPYGERYNLFTTGIENISVYTVQNVSILDIISEGPIQGFVTGSYIYSVSGKNVGDIGYSSVKFSPFVTGGIGFSSRLDPTLIVPPESRSVFWNETPLATTEGLLNFRFINFRYDYGSTNDHTVSSPKINLYEERYHYDGYTVDQNKYPIKTAVTKNIGETLYGPFFFSGTVSGLAPTKKYYIYNTEVESIRLNVKVNNLYGAILSGAYAGTVLPDQIEFGVRLWRVFSDRKEVVAVPNITVPSTNPRLFSSDTFYVRGKIQTNPTLIHYTFHLRPTAENGYFIDLMPDQIGWAYEINKISSEFNQAGRGNTTSVESITFTYPNRFTYPNTAMIYNNFNAQYFTEIPNRKYKMQLLKVKVPINYDPITKNYTGPWNGQFKLAWTDNPAWCLYDLITSNRFGLGKYIDTTLTDKWTLYEISQYCDQLVPDGLGGLEPRFACNVLISSKLEASKILDDMASVFNGILYYSAGQLFVNQDRPKESIYLFNNSNVKNGEFNYSSSAKKARRSVALVRYNDENNNYLPAIEYVEDRAALVKYGIREVEISAFGATKRSQAKRMGRWFLTTENLETETVNFEVGLDGAFLRPGDIIKIYDQNQKYQHFAGRTLELTTGYAILDVPYNSNTLLAMTGTVNPLDIKFLTPTYNLDYGTYLGNLYITGYNQNSSGTTGLNSSFFRRSQLQTISINNPKNYITSGTGAFSDYLKINFPSVNSIPENITPVNMSAVGNTFTKLSADGWGDAQAYSSAGYSKNMFAEAKANATNKYVMFALNSDPAADANYASLDYAWYFSADINTYIFENGNNMGSYGSYTTSTKLRIEYNGSWINYLKDGVIVRSVPAKTANETLYFDSSFYSNGASINANYGTFALDNYLTTLPQNTVWTVDYDASLYSGNLSNRYGMNNPNNLLYPGYYLEGYLNDLESYRVININQKTDQSYNIMALKYVDQKYTDIITGEALISVPTKIPQPNDPSLTLSILYRDPTGLYGPLGVFPAYTSNQGGINSIAYTITPPNNSGVVSLYNAYRRFNRPFVANEILDQDLFDAPASPLRNQGLALPVATGNIPFFFTPTGIGTWYVGVRAINPYSESSNLVTSSITLSQQALASFVATGGINVVGGY
jgi:hypothetical protein